MPRWPPVAKNYCVEIAIDLLGNREYILMLADLKRSARTARTWSEECWLCDPSPSGLLGSCASRSRRKEYAVRLPAVWLCLLVLGLSSARAADNVPNVVVPASATEDRASPKGSLVIIGGSERYRDRELWETIVELAGGDGASIAVFPTASGAPVKQGNKVVSVLERAGAKPFLVPVAWKEVEQEVREAVFNDEYVQRVRAAKGIFFIGGSQDRIVDALLDDDRNQTPMLRAIWEVYREGGVIAGTSAGAAIMSRVMFRSAPQPLQIMRNSVTMGKEGEAIGLAFSGLDARHQPSDGYEFRFYRGPDSKGWYTEDYGGEDYTVLNIHLDVHPIRIAGPLYEHRIAVEDSRRDSEDSAEQN